MPKSTHEKQLERTRARRDAERTEQQRGLRLVLALVVVLVVAAMALGAIFLNRGGDGLPADAVEPATEEGDGAAAGEAADGAATGRSATQQEQATGADVAAVEPCPSPGDAAPEPESSPYTERPSADLAGVDAVRATITTTCGTVVVELDAAAAPTTVGNFVALAEDGYYDGVGFHRVIDGFMIQGGDPTGTGTGCLDDACSQRLPGYTFEDELELAEEVVADSGGYPRGTLAMANAGPDTNGSQFFIVQASPGYPLPPSYAVFGQVVEGIDVVDRIALGPVDGQFAVEPVVILSIDVDR